MQHKLLYLSLFVLSSIAVAQNSRFINTGPEPIVRRHGRLFNLNSFSVHAVMYLVLKPSGTEQEIVLTDSLRLENDTLLVRVCDHRYEFCSDTLVPKGELWSYFNGSYWQKVPPDRLIKIKSKQQPLARITKIVTIVAYAGFLGGLITAAASKNETVSQAAFAVFGISDVTVLAGWATNIWVAKKRFKFNKFKGATRWVMF